MNEVEVLSQNYKGFSTSRVRVKWRVPILTLMMWTKGAHLEANLQQKENLLQKPVQLPAESIST